MMEGHAASIPQNDTQTVPTATRIFTPERDLSLDHFFTVDNHLLAAPPGIDRHNHAISAILPNGSITVVLPPPIAENNMESFENIHAQIVNASLPYLLEQFGVNLNDIPVLVAKGIPLFEGAIKASFCGSDPVRHCLHSIDDFTKFITKIPGTSTTNAACGMFAAAALPSYLTLVGILRALNFGQKATTPEQDFYTFPVHGSISHNDGIVVFYNTNFLPGFGTTDGVAMG